MISFWLCTYYNVIISWAMFYFVNSFRSPLPWAGCGNPWNSESCWDIGTGISTNTNVNNFNAVSNASQITDGDFTEQDLDYTLKSDQLIPSKNISSTQEFYE